MNTSVKIEKMPKFVQDAYGTAQKRLTLIEGEARKYFRTTYKKIRKNPSYKKVQTKVDGWVNKATDLFSISPIRKKVGKFRTDVGDRAADTIGIATKKDIQVVTRKINKLRDEVRKLSKGGKKTAK